MAFDPTKLTTFLRSSANVSLSDAAAATLASAPILTPRTARIDITTLASVWGPTRAGQFLLALQTAAATIDAARAAVPIINGPGFDVSDPHTAPTVAQFVQANWCTQSEAAAVLNVTSYACGDVVATADVTAARATLANLATIARLENQVKSGQQDAIALLEAAKTSGTIPTVDVLKAAVTAKVTG